MTKQLIINADDFGYTSGINSGILKAHQQGIVTSSTVMVNYPLAQEAIEAALQNAPTLGLGLHLNMTDGFAVANPQHIPDLIDSKGHFLTKEELRPNLINIPIGQFEAEFRTQTERFVALAGRNPDHLE